jgi:hypothetical protein
MIFAEFRRFVVIFQAPVAERSRSGSPCPRQKAAQPLSDRTDDNRQVDVAVLAGLSIRAGPVQVNPLRLQCGDDPPGTGPGGQEGGECDQSPRATLAAPVPPVNTILPLQQRMGNTPSSPSRLVYTRPRYSTARTRPSRIKTPSQPKQPCITGRTTRVRQQDQVRRRCQRAGWPAWGTVDGSKLDAWVVTKTTMVISRRGWRRQSL